MLFQPGVRLPVFAPAFQPGVRDPEAKASKPELESYGVLDPEVQDGVRLPTPPYAVRFPS